MSTLIALDCSVMASNIRVLNAHAEATGILRDIPFVTIKGCASASYYPQPVKRPMGDVDVYADPAWHDTAVRRLEENGWKDMKEAHERHRSFSKNGILLELHHEIKGVPNAPDGIATASKTAEAKVRKLLSGLVSAGRALETQHGPVLIPDDFHHGLVMLLHIAGHMVNNAGIGLRHLCDWAVYVSRVDLAQFRAQLADVGLWTFACQLTAVSSKYLGLPSRPWAGSFPDEFLDALMEDILAAGNFGRKLSGMAPARNLWENGAVRMTRERYPITQKHPVLLPVFMGAYLVRYCCLLAAGKRKLISPAMFSQLKGKEELYKQFKLFE
ncbi:MAG: nucleotidyltransferase family protein [Clostridia bacterium]|nr:nucleotidyltransferase family protein [Clostridia bacterium]